MARSLEQAQTNPGPLAMHTYGYIQALGEQHAFSQSAACPRDLRAPAAIVPAGTMLQLYIHSQHK